MEKNKKLLIKKFGLKDVFSSGRGTILLFYGPPGTGKTLTAEAAADCLRRPVMKFRIEHLLNKYVGESEQQTAELFRQAREKNAVIIFDEADSLLAARTDVRNSTDRYANTQVNQLLQKIEEYPGVMILITNNEWSLDSALERRVERIKFDKPGPEQREKLWKLHLPEKLPLSGVDYTALAKEYEYTGGEIKNVTRKILRKFAQAMSSTDEEKKIIKMETIRDICKEEAISKFKAGESAVPIGF